MKSDKGFTLVEVIISIAILSILCVIFLQLFVKASDISDSANELDQSVTLTNSIMEIVKSVGEVSEIENSKYFNDFEMTSSDSGFVLTKTYNDSFKHDSEELVYQMIITLNEKEAIVNSEITLYDVTCEVVKLEDDSILYVASSNVILE